ncbi:MAG: hypothetical protein A2487_15835 [Candidatus Raymondbacteria bacterium RifOxyC12_full_50_8]|uniref:Tetratricopeptide repeat protein n=1 Tax=Candidatus Raymondbacteria bacterium RIFOXYD12_FULL_49_13 TaxID=1817890 RepID=A0A1F7F1D2_UNCRA|nr:MAG: hypothetical protein A2248_01700 [Candidatus Raymondbacteria bacterium RIFOXYA2_FULL_49_16]OGJ95439.1 MAG: hypothetical protein A2487_15835 [Candidatus Raymondbacteria bacterium RifOxyC12_full_50_8]OGK00306.1 MAG: hypothetical protein A2519_10945 [Candidatus Raymondbacteria bacterium RIFOXYD12_FULL_49_13]OGK00652.1 MAG: hypothetical protein A2350_10480 [Candidatus Raymondbacteria bacterium RifOxyB12_full_50_8]OGP45091.1 MAG: hypothetical protein A2324_12995 [Candidatus Raymondbacteria b
MQKCGLCKIKKSQRTCMAKNKLEICSMCCAAIRNDECDGCRYYADSMKYKKELGGKKTPKFIFEVKPEIEEQIDRVLELVENNSLSEAERMLDGIPAVDSEYYMVNFARGTVMAKWDNPDDAIRYFDKALKMFPYFFPALFNKGMAYKIKMDIPNMVRAFKEAIEYGDHNNENVIWAKQFLWELNDDIRKREGVNLDTFVKAYDVFETAVKAMEEMDWEGAIRIFKECVSINPGNARSYGNMGLCYAKLGQKQEALAVFDKALQVDPDYEPAQINKASLLSLEEGETLHEGPVPIINYGLDYQAKNKSLLKDLLRKLA